MAHNHRGRENINGSIGNADRNFNQTAQNYMLRSAKLVVVALWIKCPRKKKHSTIYLQYIVIINDTYADI